MTTVAVPPLRLITHHFLGLLALAWGARMALSGASVLAHPTELFTLAAPSWAAWLAICRASAGIALALWMMTVGILLLAARADARALRPVLWGIIIVQASGWAAAVLPELPAMASSPLAFFYKGTLAGLATLLALGEIGTAWAGLRFLRHPAVATAGWALLAAALWWREGVLLVMLPANGHIWWEATRDGHFPLIPYFGLTLALLLPIGALAAVLRARVRPARCAHWVLGAGVLALIQQAWRLTMIDVAMLPHTPAGVAMGLAVALTPVLTAIEYLALIGVAATISQSPAESPQ